MTNATADLNKKTGRAPVFGTLSLAALLIGGGVFWRADNSQFLTTLALPSVLLGGLVCALIASFRRERYWLPGVFGLLANAVFLLVVIKRIETIDWSIR